MLRYKFKTILLGDTAVGKTTFLTKMTENIYNENIKISIGADLVTREFNLERTEVPICPRKPPCRIHECECVPKYDIIQCNFWDTAGQERYRSIISAYYRNVDLALIFYDVTRPETFKSCKMWVEALQKENTDIPVSCILIGTKIDINPSKAYSNDIFDRDEEYISKNYVREFRISSKNTVGINELKLFIDNQLIAKVTAIRLKSSKGLITGNNSNKKNNNNNNDDDDNEEFPSKTKFTTIKLGGENSENNNDNSGSETFSANRFLNVNNVNNETSPFYNKDETDRYLNSSRFVTDYLNQNTVILYGSVKGDEFAQYMSEQNKLNKSSCSC